MNRNSLLYSLLMSFSFLATPAAAAGGIGLDPAGFVSTLVYSAFGVVILLVSYKAFDLITGYDFHKELAEDDNPAVGVMVAGLFIGLAIIIGASIV